MKMSRANEFLEYTKTLAEKVEYGVLASEKDIRDVIGSTYTKYTFGLKGKRVVDFKHYYQMPHSPVLIAYKEGSSFKVRVLFKGLETSATWSSAYPIKSEEQAVKVFNGVAKLMDKGGLLPQDINFKSFDLRMTGLGMKFTEE